MFQGPLYLHIIHYIEQITAFAKRGKDRLQGRSIIILQKVTFIMCLLSVPV